MKNLSTIIQERMGMVEDSSMSWERISDVISKLDIGNVEWDGCKYDKVGKKSYKYFYKKYTDKDLPLPYWMNSITINVYANAYGFNAAYGLDSSMVGDKLDVDLLISTNLYKLWDIEDANTVRGTKGILYHEFTHAFSDWLSKSKNIYVKNIHGSKHSMDQALVADYPAQQSRHIYAFAKDGKPLSLTSLLHLFGIAPYDCSYAEQSAYYSQWRLYVDDPDSKHDYWIDSVNYLDLDSCVTFVHLYVIFNKIVDLCKRNKFDRDIATQAVSILNNENYCQQYLKRKLNYKDPVIVIQKICECYIDMLSKTVKRFMRVCKEKHWDNAFEWDELKRLS